MLQQSRRLDVRTTDQPSGRLRHVSRDVPRAPALATGIRPLAPGTGYMVRFWKPGSLEAWKPGSLRIRLALCASSAMVRQR